MSSTQAATATTAGDTRYKVLGAISLSHFLNDLLQSLIIAIYPLLKGNYDLNFTQIGLLTLTYQTTASLLQPLVGLYTDKHPQPYSLVVGMGSTLTGLLLLSCAPTFPLLLLGAAVVGIGSSIFHPESSRVARMASGGRHGLAQSIFQVGGNGGTAMGPLLAALIVLPMGQSSLAWFSVLALVAMVVLFKVGQWYSLQQRNRPKQHIRPQSPLPPGRIALAIGILLLLITSKYFYLASLTSYYTFYLMEHFGIGVRDAQLHLSRTPWGVTLAFSDEELAGVLQLDPERYSGDKAGYIPFCYIMPERRTQGLGIQLIGQAVSFYRPLGRQYLRLRCASYNTPAQHFYQRYGFYKIGEEQGSRVPLDILEKYIGYDR